MLIPHSRKAVRHNYWSRGDMLHMLFFVRQMTRDRYSNILRILHFASAKTVDPLWKIRPVLQSLTDKLKSYFNPFQNLVINESLMLFKGTLAFKQYIPLKWHHFEIKMFVLCDCETGTVLNL